MKILCLERDNTTYQSRVDEAGNSYRASFELYPFHEGKTYAVFKGIRNGKGPKRGLFCAVKAHVTRPSIEADWDSTLLSSKTARKMAEVFNHFVKRRAICFTQPLVAQMYRISDFNGFFKLFQHHEKKLQEKEYVVLEDFIEGGFERFSSVSGAGTIMGEVNMTQAFSHFTWHNTREYVICGLQGVHNNSVFEFTTPTIHSISGRFGQNDCQYPGITDFFSHHLCNNVCCNWDTPIKQILYQTHPMGINTYPPPHCLPPSAPPA